MHSWGRVWRAPTARLPARRLPKSATAVNATRRNAWCGRCGAAWAQRGGPVLRCPVRGVTGRSRCVRPHPAPRGQWGLGLRGQRVPRFHVLEKASDAALAGPGGAGQALSRRGGLRWAARCVLDVVLDLEPSWQAGAGWVFHGERDNRIKAAWRAWRGLRRGPNGRHAHSATQQGKHDYDEN